MSLSNIIEDLAAGLTILAKHSMTPSPLGMFEDGIFVRDVYLGSLSDEEHAELLALDWKYNHQVGGYTYPFFVRLD